MMKNLFLVFSFLYSFTLFAQSTLTVYRADNHKPLKGAKIYCNNAFLGETNEKGVATITTGCSKINVELEGFIGDEVAVDKIMELDLDRDNAKTREI